MQELIESGQFLTLSRRNSALFERSHQFTLANGTLVDITAPGIISFSVQPTSKPNKRIVLSCGVHGNEAGYEVVRNVSVPIPSSGSYLS